MVVQHGRDLHQSSKSSNDQWIVSDPAPSSHVEPGWSTN